MKTLRHLLSALALLQLGACSTTAPTMASPEPVPAFPVYAAGSLRAALSQVAQDYQARTGQAVELSFGASGLLRERLEKGEPAQLFASADMEQPQRLAAGGAWQPQVRVGTSTPRSDPAGD